MTERGYLIFLNFFMLTMLCVVLGLWNAGLFGTWVAGVPFWAVALFTGYYTIDVLDYYYRRR